MGDTGENNCRRPGNIIVVDQQLKPVVLVDNQNWVKIRIFSTSIEKRAFRNPYGD